MEDTQPPLRAGERIYDRFRIDALLTGGQGILCLVTDTHTGRRYAFKGLKEESRADPETVARFRAEALTWVALEHHENLVRALWLVEGAPGPFLVLEFVDGCDLSALLEAEGPLPLPRALDLAMQCAAGLRYAHTKPVPGGIGVVHRDVKPANLLVARGDVLKVSDFGLARVYRGGKGEGRGEGTPAYVAPEQLRADREADGRADIYSFGLVLYEMLTGSNPLAADDLQEQVERALHHVPPPLRNVPPAVAALVARCVAKDPAERPRDFAEVLGHLAAAARGLDHPWHVDPASVERAGPPTGLTAATPRFRPRRPRAGEPCAVEVEVLGDVGPGPVELEWRFPGAEHLRVLTPGGVAAARVEAGGTVRLKLRLALLAEREGRIEVPEGVVTMRGPDGGSTARVPAFEADVAFAFVLPLRGREREMDALRGLLEAAARGEGGAAFLYGGMGFGKSRLLLEVAREAAGQGARTVSSRSQESGLRPMRVLHDMARQLFGLVPDRARGLPAAIDALLQGEPAAARYFDAVLAGGEAVELEAPPLQPWLALMEASSRGGPLVVLLDDLHLADEAVLRIVLQLAARASAQAWPLLFVGAAGAPDQAATARHRREVLGQGCADWRRRGIVFPQIELPALDRTAMEALLEDVFPGHGFAEEAPWLLESMERITRGNPFHIAELLRGLRLGRERLVARRDGEWRLSPELSPETLAEVVPRAFEGVVLRRVSTLSPATRAVLDLAAVVGEEFASSVLYAAARPGQDVEAALAEMEEAEILQAVPGPEERYRFWSAMAAPVARRELARTPEDLAGLHRRVAAALLRVYAGEELMHRALAVAQHLRAGGEAVRSLPYTLVGCLRLLRMHLPERARRLLFNAKPLLEEPGVTPLLRADFLFLYGLACEATGEYEEGLEALSAFVREGRDAAEPEALPRAYLRLGRIHEAQGDYEEAGASFETARKLYESAGNRRKLAFAVAALAGLALERGQLLSAERHLGEARALAAETGNEGAAVQVRILMGRLALKLDRQAEARQAFAEAESRSAQLGDRRRRADALEGLALTAMAKGYLAEARQWIEEAVHLLARMGDRARLAAAILHLGDLWGAGGRVDRALRHYERARRVFRELGHLDGIATASHRAGRVLRACGRTTEAVQELAGAAEELGRLRLPEHHEALRELGHALADAGSERPSRIALARADRGEAPGGPRRAHRILSRVLRAELALARGDHRRARAWAARAVRHASRMTGHYARSVAQLALAETAIRTGDLTEARRAAETGLAYARQQGDPLAAAAAERILMELAGRAGRIGEALERAHRVARAYTGRPDAGDGLARLLGALGRGLARTEPGRAGRYAERARRCYQRLEGQGFRTPRGL